MKALERIEQPRALRRQRRIAPIARPRDIDWLRGRFVDAGVWVRPFGDIAYLMPALNATADDIAALCRAVVDLSGRPFAAVDLPWSRPTLGAIATENLTHVLVSLATAAGITLHVDLLKGSNAHHKAEAAFKATALALRAAVARDGSADVPSTKGGLA